MKRQHRLGWLSWRLLLNLVLLLVSANQYICWYDTVDVLLATLQRSLSSIKASQTSEISKAPSFLRPVEQNWQAESIVNSSWPKAVESLTKSSFVKDGWFVNSVVTCQLEDEQRVFGMVHLLPAERQISFSLCRLSQKLEISRPWKSSPGVAHM